MTSGPQYISLPTAAERSGRSVGHLARLCRDKYAPAGLARLQQDGDTKPEWFVSEEADPQGAFVRVKSPEQIGTDLTGLNDKKRREAFARLDLLKRWDQALSSRHQLGLPETAITQQFIATVQAIDGRPLSRSNLYAWRTRYRRGGLRALADQRGAGGGQSAVGSADSPAHRPLPTAHSAFLDLVKRLWLHVNKPTLRSCYAIAVYEMQRQDASFVAASYRTVHRWIGQIPDPVVQKYRHGDKAYTDVSAVHVERDYSGLRTNESWCGDHHQFDVIVAEGGELLRPWLTAWMDERSRKLVGWRLFAHSPNSDTILLALKDGIADHGVCHEVYIDNGRDYDCYALNGRTKADRWRKSTVRIDYDAPYLGGLFQTLGIEVTHCQPYHGQSKPIERWFNTLESQFGKVWPTYCGRSPQEKPQSLQLQLERGKAPTLAAFAEAFAAYLATYHAAAHTGDGMDGRTPDHVFAAEWQGHAKRVCSAELLWWLTLKPQHPTRVTQTGVRCNGINYGALAAELFEYRGREVLVRHDPAKLNQVFICRMDGTPICVAAANQKLPANASAQELRQVMNDMRRDHKRVKEYHQARPALAHDPAERMILARHAANQRAAAENPQPTPTPPSLQPVRSPFEVPIKELHRALESQPLRHAVGAESISFGHLGDRLASAQDDAAGAGAEDPFMKLTQVFSTPEED